MRTKKSVYLDEDVLAFLKEEAFFTDESQTDILNRAIRLYALAGNSERMALVFGEEKAAIISQVPCSDLLDRVIPARAIRT
jgi:hypothetical protein